MTTPLGFLKGADVVPLEVGIRLAQGPAGISMIHLLGGVSY